MGEKFKCTFCEMEFKVDEIPEGEGRIYGEGNTVFCSGACFQDYELAQQNHQDFMDAENQNGF